MEPIKLRVTMTWTFMANPQWYILSDRTPERIAEVEQNQEDLESALARGMEADDFKFLVEVDTP